MLLSKKTIGVVVALFLGLLGVAWTHAVPDTARVEGYVYFADAKPMARVRVLVYYANRQYVRGETDRDGHYSVEFKKNNKPIEVKYIPEQQIFFPALKGLSGSTSHSISRTQEGEIGKYSSSRAVELNNNAQEARAHMALMSDEDWKAMERYYWALLSDVRVEQGTVTNEATLEYVQFTYNETRQQYGLAAEELRNETGVPLRALTLWHRKPERRVQSPGDPELSWCMTGRVLRELHRRVCKEEPPSITEFDRTEVRDLRRSLLCKPPSKRAPLNEEGPNSRKP